MKKFRKFLVVLLSAAISMIASVSAFSGIAFVISVTNSTHTYEVYQIFSGMAYGDILVNVEWGKNGIGNDGEAVGEDVLKELEAMAGMTDREKLAVIQKYAVLDPENKFDTVSQEMPIYVEPGYYLIKDIDGAFDGADDTYTTYIVKVVTNVVVSPKSDKTTGDKKVTDVNDYTGETSVGAAADYDINDAVPFHLSAVIDSEYDRYAAYKLVFHDTLSSGLSLNEDSVSVKVDGGLPLVKGQDYNVVTTGLSDGCTFEVQFSNLKAIASVKAGSSVTVDYTATLTSDAVIGGTGNINKMVLEYSNNPNNETGSETGKTPEKTAVVFTYQMVVNKVTKNPDYDPEQEGSSEYIPLTGAEFVLDKKVGSKWERKETVMSEDGTVFTFSGLDEGVYRLRETLAPEKYNYIDPIYFMVTSGIEGNQVISLSGNQTDSKGILLEGDQITASFSGDAQNGVIASDVVNVMGVQLPETGGTGTALFYMAGGSMIMAAAVLLVLRRRLNAKKENQ